MTNTQRRPNSRYGAWHRLPLLLIMVTLFSGCAAFSWIPGIGDDDDEENTDPAKLVDFDAEVYIERQWKVKVGDGLGKKYIRLQPSIAAERIVAADAYGTVAAFDRFSGQKIWQQKIGEEE